ncbi:hypothetical protein TNCV_4552541 [Trichonephila clavipes]|nr:hypothetical protein TNCV_4552541 [Trichonephila clavipes]
METLEFLWTRLSMVFRFIEVAFNHFLDVVHHCQAVGNGRLHQILFAELGLATKMPCPEGSSPYAFPPSLASDSKKIAPS